MEYINEFAVVPAIAIITYLIAEIFKVIASGRENWLRFIPVICGALGGILGIAGWLCIPGYIPAENAFTAAAIGIISGLAATGANQIGKQLKKTSSAGGQTAQTEEDQNEDQDG